MYTGKEKNVKIFSSVQICKKQILRQEFIFWFFIGYAIPGSSSEARGELTNKKRKYLWRGVQQSWLLRSIRCNGFLLLLRPSSERAHSLLHFRIGHWQVVSRKQEHASSDPFFLVKDLTHESLIFHYPREWSWSEGVLPIWSCLLYHCCYSVIKSCLILCDPMNCSTPVFSVFHYLLELLKLMSIYQWFITLTKAKKWGGLPS